LFARAVDLLPVTDPDRVRYGIELGISLAWGGREVRALEVLADADAAAAAIGDLGLQTHAALALTEIGSWREASAWVRWRPEAERAIEVFEPAGDEAGLARAWYLLAWDLNVRCHYAEKDRALLRALDHAEAAGDRRLRAELLGMWSASVWGPVSVNEGLARCGEVLARGGGSREFEADVARTQAAFEAMRGDFAQARARYSDGKAMLDDLARPVVSAFAVQEGWYIEMIARDFRRAEELTRSEYGRQVEADSLALQDITRDMLALALCAQERFEEADALASETERKVFALGDITAQNVWRRVHARALSARSEHGEAVRVAREAEALFDGTDALIDHGECLLDLAEVLRAAGKRDEAADAAQDALALYEQKENIVEAGRAKGFLAELAR
jgi:tetratricopeptide (TPR) repeat protein